MVGWLVDVLNGKLTNVSYLIPNPVYTHAFNVYDL